MDETVIREPLIKDAAIRVLVVDDQFVVRMGLVSIIDAQSDMQVVAEALNGRMAIELFRRHLPQITLMDLRMPVMDGIEATRSITSEFPQARIIVLTTYEGEEDIHRALQAGARGYLLKDALRDELLSAIRAVYSGRKFIPPAVAAALAERIPMNDLTSRELEVLGLIVKGMNNADIAAALSISKGTVKIHVNNILSKMGVSDRTQAATAAIKRGIVHLY
jgi:two-component system NarL family response regulator